MKFIGKAQDLCDLTDTVAGIFKITCSDLKTPLGTVIAGRDVIVVLKNTQCLRRRFAGYTAKFL